MHRNLKAFYRSLMRSNLTFCSIHSFQVKNTYRLTKKRFATPTLTTTNGKLQSEALFNREMGI